MPIQHSQIQPLQTYLGGRSNQIYGPGYYGVNNVPLQEKRVVHIWRTRDGRATSSKRQCAVYVTVKYANPSFYRLSSTKKSA